MKEIIINKKLNLLMTASYKHTIIMLILHLSETSFILFTLTRTNVKNAKTMQSSARIIMNVIKSVVVNKSDIL